MTSPGVDYILEIYFDTSDLALEELVQSRLYLTESSGSITSRQGITAFFDAPTSRTQGMSVLGGLPVKVIEVERQRMDWLRQYEQSLEPIVSGNRFLVVPDARLITAGTTRFPIVVPQEQAFGTGSHETTALCIELLESVDVRGRRGLDIGSGTGILAIAMFHLGARRVIAFDNDLSAYGALRDNRMRNRVPEMVMPVFIGSVESLRGGAFDVITMNIIPEVILPLLDDVIARLKSGGVVILSGILNQRADEVKRACAARGLAVAEERSRGEWWAGVFR